ncbi:hypothetical protein [Arenivirga flava]|uniref:Uncharacterized protein n=1 Tax=Arenivirga flava TaxID=1930060 RepID=A0AA37UU31_9MICO|nr:hypothetical protein [Arenivirga flava]GMA28522.1 hypothetical protein GCM10025874_17750 [Arenivirga flava]
MSALVLGAAIGAACVAWAGGLLRGDAFDRFTAPIADARSVTESAALLATMTTAPGSIHVGGDAVVATLLAGPVPLHSSHGVDLHAALAVSAAGDQLVCLVEMRGDAGVTPICVTRSQFEDEGVSHPFARDDERNAILEIVWRADDSVTIREADLSTIG